MVNSTNAIWKIGGVLLVAILFAWLLFQGNHSGQEEMVTRTITKGNHTIQLEYDKTKLILTPNIDAADSAKSWWINIVGINQNAQMVLLGNHVTYRASAAQKAITIVQKKDMEVNTLDKILFDIAFMDVPHRQIITLNTEKPNGMITVNGMQLQVNGIQCKDANYMLELVPLTNENGETILYLQSPDLIKQELYENEDGNLLILTLKKETVQNQHLSFDLQGITFKIEHWELDLS